MAQVPILCGTWNVGEKRGSAASVFQWLGCRCKGVGLVVAGLQEIEMGGGSVAIAAAKDRIAASLQERGNANAQYWSGMVQQALEAGEPTAGWERVGLRQMSGILLLVFARRELLPHIGRVRCQIHWGSSSAYLSR